jgi:hypothetical protein
MIRSCSLLLEVIILYLIIRSSWKYLRSIFINATQYPDTFLDPEELKFYNNEKRD